MCLKKNEKWKKEDSFGIGKKCMGMVLFPPVATSFEFNVVHPFRVPITVVNVCQTEFFWFLASFTSVIYFD